MAALRVVPPACVSLSTPHRVHRRGACGAGRRAVVVLAAHTVTVEHRGKTHTLTLDDDTTILEAALDAGVDLPHDCKARVGTAVALWLGARQPCICVTRPALWPEPRCSSCVTLWRCCVALLWVKSSHSCAPARCPAVPVPLTPQLSFHHLTQMGVCMTCPAKLVRCGRLRVLPATCVAGQEPPLALTQCLPTLLAFSAAVRLTRAAAACLATTCRRRALCCSAAAGQWVTAR
jgi:hypothetical protein